MPVETAWLISSAMLIPLERMRVGINSESASHTHTPGPMAKKAMNTKSVMATFHPLLWLGRGVMRALSIRNGAWRAASRSPKGLEKNATTLLAGTQLSRVISIGMAAVSSERAALVAEIAIRINDNQRSWTREIGRAHV